MEGKEEAYANWLLNTKKLVAETKVSYVNLVLYDIFKQQQVLWLVVNKIK